MAHGSEESEDYWPGYVDALTSMVQVLAFVMMLLAMAVFVLSQSITKSAVEEIAKAAKVDAPKDISIQELVAKIVKQLERSDGATSASAARQASAASAAPAASASAVEMEKSLPQSVGPAQAERPAIPGAKQEKPAAPSRDAKRFVVRFANRSYALESEEAANIEKFVGAQQVVEKNAQIFVRAYAYSGGGLTEARRIAYYRAIMVRAELIRKKTPPANIQVNVFDSGDPEQGSTVDVFVDGKAPG